MINARLISRLRSIDWDFPGNLSESPFSALHWHPSRFMSQLPATLIGLLSKPGDLILDPFSGSGTTLVEAQRLGRRSIGIDLNPISCLVARAKTYPLAAKSIKTRIERIKTDAFGCLSEQLSLVEKFHIESRIPESVQANKWFTPRVREDLGLLWGLIQTYRGAQRVLAQTSFSAILLPVCRETRHWGYVCDNSTPKENYEGNVLNEFSRILERFERAYNDREADILGRVGKLTRFEEAKNFCGETMSCLQKIPNGSVNLVITSPPYFGVSDYIKSQRLSMEWFGYDIEPLRLLEIGARSKRHRKVAKQEYLTQLQETFYCVHRVIKEGGLCVVIIGQSVKRNTVLKDINKSLDMCGFNLQLDINRKISSQRRQAPSITGEHLLIFKK